MLYPSVVCTESVNAEQYQTAGRPEENDQLLTVVFRVSEALEFSLYDRWYNIRYSLQTTSMRACYSLRGCRRALFGADS